MGSGPTRAGGTRGGAGKFGLVRTGVPAIAETPPAATGIGTASVVASISPPRRTITRMSALPRPFDDRHRRRIRSGRPAPEAAFDTGPEQLRPPRVAQIRWMIPVGGQKFRPSRDLHLARLVQIDHLDAVQACLAREGCVELDRQPGDL